MDLEELIGKSIVSVFVSSDKKLIKFECADGDICYEAYGDCCSESFIELVLRPNVYGEYMLVKSVEEVEMPSIIVSEYSEHKLYGIKIHVQDEPRDRGHEIFIEFRNTSNGYYGGDLRLTKDFKEEKHWIEQKP